MWMRSTYPIVIGIALLASLLVTFTGCGKEEYVKQQFEVSSSAVGFRYLPSKVDILIVPDNSGSINMAFSAVQAQLAGFISTLQGRYWDYHVASATMINPAPITKVLVNPEFNTPYLADGTPKAPGGIVPSSRAVTSTSNFSILDGTVASGGGDYTYDNIYSVLNASKSDTYTNFFRGDSLLAVIVVTNGAEYTVDPSHNGNLNLSMLQLHANKLKSLKGGTDKLIRFYPVASYSYKTGSATNSCLIPGGTAWSGDSYFAMNNYIPGLSKFQGGMEILNFCNENSINNVMSSIEKDLEIVKQAYVYCNIVLGEDHDPNSIHLYKNGAEIPRITADPNNGWDYKGKGTVYTITGVKDPNTNVITPLNPGLSQQTGYVIALKGNGCLVGSDTFSLTYENK